MADKAHEGDQDSVTHMHVSGRLDEDDGSASFPPFHVAREAEMEETTSFVDGEVGFCFCPLRATEMLA